METDRARAQPERLSSLVFSKSEFSFIFFVSLVENLRAPCRVASRPISQWAKSTRNRKPVTHLIGQKNWIRAKSMNNASAKRVKHSYCIYEYLIRKRVMIGARATPSHCPSPLRDLCFFFYFGLLIIFSPMRLSDRLGGGMSHWRPYHILENDPLKWPLNEDKEGLFLIPYPRILKV